MYSKDDRDVKVVSKKSIIHSKIIEVNVDLLQCTFARTWLSYSEHNPDKTR
jgi:hypothetical protein